MSRLEITASLPRARALCGESVRVDVELRNVGDAIASVPYLGMNNGALALVVCDDAGTEIGAYTWADARRRLQEIKFDPEQATLQDLRPGDSDGLTRDLLLLREPLAPGAYTVRARLRHASIAVESAPVPLEILPRAPRELLCGADGDALGPWHLHAAWIDSIDGRPWSIQGATFDTGPGVMNHVDRAFALAAPWSADAARLSRGLGPSADHHCTLVRVENHTLRWSTLAMALPVTEHALGIGAHERVIGTPWRLDTATFVLLGAGDAPAIRLLRLDDDGTSAVIGAATTPPTERRELVLDTHGVPWCLALADEGNSSVLWQCGFDGAPAVERLRARTRGAGLCVTHGLARQPIAAVVVLDDEPQWLVSWALRGDTFAEQIAGPRLPRAREGQRWSFAIGTHGGLHGLLHRPDRAPLYADPFGEVQEHPGLADLREPVHLLAGRRGEPYVAALDRREGVVMRALAAANQAGVAGLHVH